ncbi:hypothetical protein AAKU55_005522 [Oxalobacteraceae bacterium GrIS 1.11]
MAVSKDTSVTTIDDEPSPLIEQAAKPLAVTDHGDNFAGRYFDVTIHNSEGEVGRQAVFLGINGHGLNIPRGKPVRVPAEVVEILENAMQIIYEPLPGGGTIEREVLRFPFIARPAANLAK